MAGTAKLYHRNTAISRKTVLATNNNDYITRYFNSIEYVSNIQCLRKLSKNMTKLKEEYEYYYLLPETVQRFFVQPFGFTIQGEVGYYFMEEWPMPDAGTLSTEGEMSDASFSKLFSKIKLFKKVCPDEPALDSQVDENARYLVLEKTKQRLEELKNSSWYESEYAIKIEESKISLDTLYEKLEKAFEEAYQARTYKRIVLSHGDLTLSNILWDSRLGLMKLIDPRGSTQMYMDEYYDYAKLSQSINGAYDDIIHGNYKVEVNTLSLNITRPANQYIIQTFNNYLGEINIDLNLLRLYEAALFLSMTPHHVEDHKRVTAFILSAAIILKKYK